MAQSGIVGEPVSIMLANRVTDDAGVAITTLSITDFGITLTNPSKVTKYLKGEGVVPGAPGTISTIPVAFEHIKNGGYGKLKVDGAATAGWTPDVAGSWLLQVTYSTVGIDETVVIEVLTATEAALLPASATITNVATLMLLPGFDSTLYDAGILTGAVSAACKMIENWCDRLFASAAFTDTLDGNGRDEIWLTQRPITAVTSLTIDDQLIPVADYTVLTNSIYYALGFSEGGYDAGFTSGRRNVVVVYTAGYSALLMPLDLKLTATRLAADILRASARDGSVTSVKLGNWSESYAGLTASGRMAGILDPYKAELAPYRRLSV